MEFQIKLRYLKFNFISYQQMVYSSDTTSEIIVA